jgi:hypothetical protein
MSARTTFAQLFYSNVFCGFFLLNILKFDNPLPEPPYVIHLLLLITGLIVDRVSSSDGGLQ